MNFDKYTIRAQEAVHVLGMRGFYLGGKYRL